MMSAMNNYERMRIWREKHGIPHPLPSWEAIEAAVVHAQWAVSEAQESLQAAKEARAAFKAFVKPSKKATTK